MFKPLSMLKLSLLLLLDDAQTATAVLARSGIFNPELIDAPESGLPELPAEPYRAVLHSAQARLDKIKVHLPAGQPQAAKARIVSQSELEQLDQRLGELWREFSTVEEQHHLLSDKLHTLQQLRDSLQIFSSLEVDLGLFQQSQGFLTLHLGTIANHNLAHLEKSASLAGSLVRPFNRTGDTTYVVVAGPTESDEAITALLKTADFHPLKIPQAFADYPETIESGLIEKQAELESQLVELSEQLEQLKQHHSDELDQACRTLHLAGPYAALADCMRGRRQLALIEGWIPADQVQSLTEALSAELEHPFVLNIRKPLPEEHGQVPSLLRHARPLSPFVALVKNYGVPRYGEIDPTWLFTLSFILMFGMMFGDIGHGFVFVLIGIALRRRWPAVMPFMAAAGFSSMLFGLLYSSVFGYEELFPPLWMAPLHDPLLMLKVGLYWGIGFIYLASLLRIYNSVTEGQIGRALFDNKGVAGLLLYSGGIFAGFRWLGEGVFGLTETLALLIPLSVIMLYKWRRMDSPFGERALVVSVEGFESIMNYLANTLSFLRVAAFSLNHVALAVAVFTLANMMDATGHWITVVLGNLFIIVVEGAIVTIQVLRLEYYELFSRFFSGDGRRFKPLRYRY